MTEKEPLPQSVEVLLHTAARAATFLIFSSHTGCFSSSLRSISRSALFQSYAITQTATLENCVKLCAYDVPILCSCVGSFMARERTSHHNGFNLMQPTRAASPSKLPGPQVTLSFNLMQSHGLLRQRYTTTTFFT